MLEPHNGCEANADDEEKQCHWTKRNLRPHHRGVREKEEIGGIEEGVCMKDGCNSHSK